MADTFRRRKRAIETIMKNGHERKKRMATLNGHEVEMMNGHEVEMMNGHERKKRSPLNGHERKKRSAINGHE